MTKIKLNSSLCEHPFGMIMPGRNFNAVKYRFGFNGKEIDDEVKGMGNSLDFGARMFDPRIGRWLSVDPILNASQSTYSSFDNNPIYIIDPNGESGKAYIRGNTVSIRPTTSCLSIFYHVNS